MRHRGHTLRCCEQADRRRAPANCFGDDRYPRITQPGVRLRMPSSASTATITSYDGVLLLKQPPNAQHLGNPEGCGNCV